MIPDLHPDLAPLACLLGTWEGEGDGEYPTIEPFGYLETVLFTHVGKPFVAYQQRTRARDDGRPLHAEAGYLRVPAEDVVELMLAHPTGLTELSEGTLRPTPQGIVAEVRSIAIGRTGTAKEVRAVERHIEVAGDELSYEVRMAAVGQPMTHHLAATLRRLPSG